MFYIRLGERQENLRGEPLTFSVFKLLKNSLFKISNFQFFVMSHFVRISHFSFSFLFFFFFFFEKITVYPSKLIAFFNSKPKF
jgi:hypothetical protein